MVDPEISSTQNQGLITITIEYTGLWQTILGVRREQLSLLRETDFHGVLRVLAEQYPVLDGMMIDATCGELLEANMLCRNEDLLEPEMLDGQPQDGDRLMLLSMIKGG